MTPETDTFEEPFLVTGDGRVVSTDIDALLQEGVKENVAVVLADDTLGRSISDLRGYLKHEYPDLVPVLGKSEADQTWSKVYLSTAYPRSGSGLHHTQMGWADADNVLISNQTNESDLHSVIALIKRIDLALASIIGNDDAPSEKDRLSGKLQSYTALPKGWDGYEGEPPTHQAVADALACLEKKPTDIPLPYPELATDGEVGLYWQSDRVFSEIGFYGDGTFSYYAKHRKSDGQLQEAWKDDCSVDEEWPEDLLLILGKLER